MTDPIVYVEDTRPTLHWGNGVPSSGLGIDGDGYIDIAGSTFYGPKASGAWGAGTSFVGATGATGATGAAGATLSVETGSIIYWAGLSVPANYLICNGQSVSRATYANLFAALTSSMGTATITIATPGVVTFNSHGLTTGDCVYFTTTGALPTGLAPDTSYFVVNPTTNTFQLAATLNGAAIATSGSQSGTHTLKRCPWGGMTATNFAVPDFRGRTLVGLDNMGGVDAGTLNLPNSLGYYGGLQGHTLTTAELPSHSHAVGTLTTSTTGNHTHTTGLSFQSSGLIGATGGSSGSTTATGTAGSHSHTISGATATAGSGAEHNNMQPYKFVNILIRI